MRRLHPGPTEATSIADAYASPLGTPSDTPGGRPWIGISMVTSIDGSIAVAGVSGGLSSSNDTGVLGRLRTIADVIVVGAGTVREEGYGPPRKSGQRVGVVSGRGSVNTTSELFTSGAGFVITTESARFADNGVDVIRTGTDELDIAEAMRRIPSLIPGCRFVQAEGGATLNGALADADLIDEMNITTSPVTVGGNGPRLIVGRNEVARAYDLAQLVTDDDLFLFSRWRRRRT